MNDAPLTTTANQTSAEASALINQDDAQFAETFGLTDLIKPAAPAEPESGTNVPETGTEAAAAESEATEEVAAEQPRDEKGRFTAREGEAEAPAEKPAEPAAPAEPEKPAAPPRALATEFVVRDTDGQEIDVASLADLVIEFKGDGKVHKEPLDKIVRLAQTGRYNQRLHDELTDLRTSDSEKTHRLTEAESLTEQLRAELVRYITDDDYLMQRREEYAKLHTPESEIQRLRREIQEMKQGQERARFESGLQEFAAKRLEPALQSLQQQYPTVTEDELLGRFYRLVAPLKRNGEIPPQAFDRVISMVEGEIGPWMAHLHDTRSAPKSAPAEKKATVELTKAQEAATKAKKALSRLTKPAGAPPAPRETPKPRQIVNAQDAMDDIIADVTNKLVGTA